MTKKAPKTGEPQQKKYQLNHGHYFLFFLLFVSIFTCYKILKPYLNPIILATILAILVKPIYQKLARFFGGRRNLAAFLTCTLLTLVVVLPLAFMLIALIQQGIQSFNAIYDWIAAGKYKALGESTWVVSITTIVQKYLPDIQKFFPDFDLNSIRIDRILLQASSTVGRKLLNQSGQLFGNITILIGQFFLMLFAFFFIVRDQDKMFDAILHLVPLSASHEKQILEKIKSVAQSALFGTLITAIAQGFAGGIAFHIADLPGFFWGTAMAFASLIPVIGTALIWIPAAFYLFLSGHWGYSLFIVLWCAIVVGMIDNFVRPLFMKGSGETMSTLLIFLSIIGGINYFGLIGLLYGPLIIGLTIVLLYIYSLEFKSFLNQQDKR
jgi:predicted PurR-regulated permease PerM